MKRLGFFLLTAISLAACKGADPAPAPAAQTAASAPAATTWPGPIHRGSTFGESAEISLADVLVAPDKFAGKTLKTRGVVARACQKKGCWMELQPEGESKGVRVTFKDYGFFVPTDSMGAKAVVEGIVEIKKLSEQDAQHLASEGAKITRNEAGEAVEIAMVASAVELEKKN
jgi:hypothetical protein